MTWEHVDTSDVVQGKLRLIHCGWGFTGGMSGLYHALTGQHLPGGRLEAVAEGNALGKGPVVFEVHYSAIDIVRKLAASESPPLFCCFPVFLQEPLGAWPHLLMSLTLRLNGVYCQWSV